jgi:hypothetical protein
LLIGVLESNGIPVLSVFGKTITSTEQNTNKQADDKGKESEILRIEASSRLHQYTAFNFTQLIFLLPVNCHPGFTSKFPDTFYSEVLTPPPNC